MLDYTPTEARSWARGTFDGTIAVTQPSFSADFTRIDEAAIAHDVLKLKDLGFSGTLLVAEVNITPEENARVTAVAREAGGPDFALFFHAMFPTLEQNVHAARLAEAAGVDRALLAYPSSFWPTSYDEVFDYTKTFCDETGLATMLFPLPAWGFERIHPAGMSVDFVRRVLDGVPNIVAIKSEQGYPGIPGVMEMYHHFREEVVISCPIEAETIPLMSALDFQFSGTSNTHWMSDYYPRAFDLARTGKWEEAMELYWQVHPARLANSAVSATSTPGTSTINRTQWKYQEWLAGFHGGALRPPAQRLPDRYMKQLRAALVASGLPVTDSPDEDFVRGRGADRHH
ncbi:dihydrodipicolinate synthase family protein [Rhodococcus sp. Leaf258]|uniref:dihydrodipicolinate synthase family protein n=1 Tax=Rhodococcus sp. Leaf258 TaxID=1736310 RepID=UPI0006F9D941|nr:dihydrodipicolinate synthase family protein [Rhodococcus sp. Leaf258]KQU38448.1 dihydrodipicolinate synthetase [Rhodococcus sp. Leaf225]KQU39811.1 dihydrodipicolinate synthetase [Rhodococcus sp. Leaf258]